MTLRDQLLWVHRELDLRVLHVRDFFDGLRHGTVA